MSDIKTLAEELLRAKVAYYTEPAPIMSDAEFDRKLRELKELDPSNPVITLIGTPTVSGQKVNLKYKMVSTEKTLEISEMDRYWRRLNPIYTKDLEIVESLKIDGLSINLTYLDGKLVRATTSGNGEVGSDKTAKAYMMSIPKELPEAWSGQISGEAHMTDANFGRLNEILREEGAEEQKTTRNSTAGLINSENLTRAAEKLQLLDFKVWGVYEDEKSTMWGSYQKYTDQLEKARQLGFTPVEYRLVTRDTWNGEEGLARLSDVEYECDGLVYRVNDNAKAESLGAADDYLNAVTALKPVPEGALTTVTAITWEVGSKEITPTIHYEPITLGGAVCTKVAGHSLKNLIALEAFVGNRIYIQRSGGVVPRGYHRNKAELL